MIYRFTGPPENWLTATHHKAWAFNEGNKGLWSRLVPGDVAIFHSTGKTDITGAKPKPSVIGIGYIGSGAYQKEDFWWIQEKTAKVVIWPYVIPFKEMYFFSDTEAIDFETDISTKESNVVAREIEYLLSASFPIDSLIKKARSINPAVPSFPVNGSASKINEIYEELILGAVVDFYAPDMQQGVAEVEERLEQSIDEKISKMSDSELLAEAASYIPPQENYTESKGKTKVRKESQRQKRLIAKLYDYSCQVCGFRVEYKRENGTTAYIIEVDHIKDKAAGGDESLKNLWSLCPNCHKKKTRCIIRIDVEKKTVIEEGILIKITDKHLFT